MVNLIKPIIGALQAKSIIINGTSHNVINLPSADFFYKNAPDLIKQDPLAIYKSEGKFFINQHFNELEDLIYRNEMTYHEIEIHDVEVMPPKLYPVSSCLKGDKNLKGSIENAYLHSYDISQSFGPSWGFKLPFTGNMTFAATMSLGYGISIAHKASFGGTHSCSTIGQDVQIMVQPHILRGNMTIGENVINRSKNRWFKKHAFNDGSIYFLDTHIQPIVHCVTADKYPLQCDFRPSDSFPDRYSPPEEDEDENEWS